MMETERRAMRDALYPDSPPGWEVVHWARVVAAAVGSRDVVPQAHIRAVLLGLASALEETQADLWRARNGN
jgi:hypothetical protein